MDIKVDLPYQRFPARVCAADRWIGKRCML